jgi:gluconate 2-dehydrogenase alpha chain
MSALTALNPYEARIAAAAFERMFPGSTEIGVAAYLDRALAGAYHEHAETYRVGLATLDRVARERRGAPFADCDATAQDALLEGLEAGTLPEFHVPRQEAFFALLRAHLQEGLFADPVYGGNRDKAGWRLLGHTGVWLANSAEENLATEPVTKGGVIQSLADVGYSLDGGPREPVDVPGYDPQRGALPPAEDCDAVIVGVGAAGALAARLLARAGLRIVGLEAGPWRTSRDFVPDELASAYYCRGAMGRKFLAETPRWRTADGEPTGPATFTAA